MLPGETPLSVIMDYMGVVLGFFEMVLGLLLFLVSQNRIKSFLKSLRKIDRVETELMMEDDDYEKHFHRLAISLMMFDCFCLVRNNSNPIALKSNDIHVILWMWYGLLGLTPSNTVILFVWVVAIVQGKFCRLNGRIKSFIDNDLIARSHGTGGASSGIVENPSYLFCQKINMVSLLHRELRHAIHLIEQHFAILVLLNSVKLLLSFTSSAHITYRYLKNREYYTWDDLIYTLHTSGWVATPVVVMCAISNVCGSTRDEANDTGNLLHALLNDCQMCDNLRKLPMTATAAGYLTIMLQFYD
ncbi:uncharacterized protein [Venturia canescens]|uniref:uncharacterized protein isoform X2 n=1 Tax=Venturia canescens TaxID=32260 RepID=UPI001C9CA49C|nr:uncharacterized protein LOC122416122 isoform X2 [Venturia canescens]